MDIQELDRSYREWEIARIGVQQAEHSHYSALKAFSEAFRDGDMGLAASILRFADAEGANVDTAHQAYEQAQTRLSAASHPD